MQTMTQVYFNCSDPNHILMDSRGTTVSSLSEACAHAFGFVHAAMMTPNSEDWRGWELRVTDELGNELFVIPFAAALGRLH
jgi:streptogramin lyase